MKVEVESAVLPHPREEVWRVLLDPEALARLLPGVERFETVAEDDYAVVVKLGVGAVRGTYTGRVRLADRQPPERYRLEGEAKGAPGWAKGEAVMNLLAVDGGTRIVASGQARVGGAIAGVGQRMMEGVAQSMARAFFASVDRELAGRQPEPVTAAGFGWRVLLDVVRSFFARLLGRGDAARRR